MKKVMILGAFVALLAMTGCYEKKEASKDVVSFDEVLTTRRSIRSYDASKKISEAEVRELLTATQEAPSWANQQPTKYYVAISPEKLAAVQDMVGGNKERIKDAPVLIVSTFERGKSGFFQGNQTNEVGDGWGAYDNGLSNCYLILKARAMGFVHSSISLATRRLWLSSHWATGLENLLVLNADPWTTSLSSSNI